MIVLYIDSFSMAIIENNNVSKTWFNVQSVPQSHMFSLEDRPGTEPIPVCKTIPIIDLDNSERTVQDIIKASKEFGFFQVINHGVPEDVIEEAYNVLKELFCMPSEEISKEANSSGYVYMGSISYAPKGAHLWRDNIKHPCHPLEECMQYWPLKPTQYRDFVGAYIVEIRKLSLRILDLISEGLGIEKGYIGGISQVQFLTASNYPACPDPSLTLGLLKHFDHSLITILFQGNVEGLQVTTKDGKWIGVKALSNAFVVNIGTQLEVISNGALRSAQHRVVTNPYEDRTTIATFINPGPDCVIEPAKALVNELNPPLYKPVSFKEFATTSKAFGPYTDVVTNGAVSRK